MLSIESLNSSSLAQQSDINLCDFDRIKKFDTNGKVIGSWGIKGNNDGEFLHPHGIAVDSSGNVYVTDEQRQDVQKFDSEGKFILKWGSDGLAGANFLIG